jgi:hypothetical protein
VLAAPFGVLAVSWALVGVAAAFSGMMSLAVARVLRLPARAFARAYGPGLSACAGVLAAAGAVRLAWDATSVPAATAATLAGALGAVLALRLLAPASFVDLVRQLRGLRPAPRQVPLSAL